jgi:hypothetical protein
MDIHVIHGVRRVLDVSFMHNFHVILFYLLQGYLNYNIRIIHEEVEE